jgi:pSer/pThr/pTyr-binding forkhead associated (FHA) protein
MENISDEIANGTLPQDMLLILDLRDQHASVNYEQPSITMGRDSNNRIVINHSSIYRRHVRIEMRKDQFILTDYSAK